MITIVYEETKDHKEHFGEKMVFGFAKILLFITPACLAPLVSVLENRYVMQCHHKYDVIVLMCNVISAKYLFLYSNPVPYFRGD